MAYSEDYRKRVMEYLDEGYTWDEARIAFNISYASIAGWRKKYKETGEVKRSGTRQATYKKLEPAKLRAYVEEHPDAYLKEIGEAFGCSDTAVMKALKRLGITRKKRPNATTSKTRNR